MRWSPYLAARASKQRYTKVPVDIVKFNLGKAKYFQGVVTHTCRARVHIICLNLCPGVAFLGWRVLAYFTTCVLAIHYRVAVWAEQWCGCFSWRLRK